MHTRFIKIIPFLLLLANPSLAQNPETHVSGVSLQFVATASAASVRIDYDAANDRLVFSTAGGDIYGIDSPFVGQSAQLLYSAINHGVAGSVLGFAVGGSGNYYVVGNRNDGSNTIATIARGTPDGLGGHDWSILAETVPYPRSGTPFDHLYNGIIESPDGEFVFVNGGSRTDHGEVQTNNGAFPLLRELPLTSVILRLPSNGDNVILQNNEDSLRAGGFLYADGVRNSFDFAFDSTGNLFATENSGDRDDNEEINWIREGHHYGFPWRMGTNDTPQQFASYDPGQDLLINPGSYASSNGFFQNDPTFPTPPSGVVFSDPILNTGSYANSFRDATDGLVKDADNEGVTVSTLTPHRSPLGLVFDTQNMLAPGFTGAAFVLSWTGPSSNLLGPFGDEGEDLLRLSLAATTDNYETSVERVVSGFSNPIDAVQIGDNIYVLEYGGSRTIWQVSFADVTSVETVDSVSPELYIFPNPTAEKANLTMKVAVSGAYTVELFDMAGRRVIQLFDGQLSRGTSQNINVDVANMPPGVYVARMLGPSFVKAEPFIIVR
jgi:glucose/arabinose dehydrogenase